MPSQNFMQKLTYRVHLKKVEGAKGQKKSKLFF